MRISDWSSDVCSSDLSDKALHREDGVVGIGDGLALGGLADQPLAVLGEGNDGRRRARAFRVLDHLRLAAFHDSNAAVCGAEIDTDNFCHMILLCPNKIPARALAWARGDRTSTRLNSSH